RFLRHLFRHQRRPGLRLGRRRRQLERHRARFARCAFRGGSDAAIVRMMMIGVTIIRVMLPAHLRTLARVSGEVSVEISGEPTLVSVLNALETQYPVLRGTSTQERRPFVRFYACEEDYSHEPAETKLPSAVVSGKEPFLIVGAMSGG